MTQRFALHQHNNGWFRLTAETPQKVTILVCECESRELALHLQSCYNNASATVQEQIIMNAGEAILPGLAKSA